MNQFCNHCNKECPVSYKLIDIYDKERGVMRLNVQIVICLNCKKTIDNLLE